MAKKISVVSLIVLFLLLALIASGYFFYEKSYAGKIYRNVYLFGENMAGKDITELNNTLKARQETLLAQEFNIESGTKNIAVKMADTGVGYDLKKSAEDVFNVGRNKKFATDLAEASKTLFMETNIEPTLKTNQAKFDNFVTIAIGQMNNPPADATLVIENGTIKQTEGQSGLTVDTADLNKQILNIFQTENFSTKVVLNNKTTAPNVQVADFAAAKSLAQSYLDKKLTLKYEGQNFTPNNDDIGYWIEFTNNNGQFAASLNDSNIKAYLNKIAKNFEIATINRKINEADNSVIEEGRQGKYLDMDPALLEVKKAMNQSGASEVILTIVTTEPKEIRVPVITNDVQLGRFEGKYIDINLSTQKLCRVEGTTLIDCFTVSSGKASMPTPTGTFAIGNKDPRRWSTTYGLWMPFWQEFKDGVYGIHELPEWPNGYKEGEAHLGTPVSHGCVRLGVGAAETVFNWTDIGTTVFIHK